MLRDDFDCEMVFQHFDVGVGTYGSHQSALNFGAGVVGVVQNAKLGMSALAVQVEITVFFFIKIHAPAHQLLDLRRCISHDLLHGGAVAYPIAGYHGVFDVFFEIIDQQICYRCNAALRFGGVGFFQGGFAHDGNFSFLGTRHLQGKTHAGNAATYDQKIKFSNHLVSFLNSEKLSFN